MPHGRVQQYLHCLAFPPSHPAQYLPHTHTPPYLVLGAACPGSPLACSYVLTQFQSHTLNSHIAASYPGMKFGPPDSLAWVDVLAAQQTVTEREW